MAGGSSPAANTFFKFDGTSMDFTFLAPKLIITCFMYCRKHREKIKIIRKFFVPDKTINGVPIIGMEIFEFL
jgi:hypothetical protein